MLIYVTTWMNLENLMLGKISHTQKDKIVSFHLFEISRISKLRGTESILEVIRG